MALSVRPSLTPALPPVTRAATGDTALGDSIATQLPTISVPDLFTLRGLGITPSVSIVAIDGGITIFTVSCVLHQPTTAYWCDPNSNFFPYVTFTQVNTTEFEYEASATIDSYGYASFPGIPGSGRSMATWTASCKWSGSTTTCTGSLTSMTWSSDTVWTSSSVVTTEVAPPVAAFVTAGADWLPRAASAMTTSESVALSCSSKAGGFDCTEVPLTSSPSPTMSAASNTAESSSALTRTPNTHTSSNTMTKAASSLTAATSATVSTSTLTAGRFIIGSSRSSVGVMSRTHILRTSYLVLVAGLVMAALNLVGLEAS